MRPQPIIETTADGTHKAVGIGIVRNGCYANVSITEARRWRKSVHLTRSELVRFCNAGLDFAAAMPVEREV